MMGIILKLMANPVLRAIVSALLSWLGSQCAAFVAKHLGHAKKIAEQAVELKHEDGSSVPGKEKFQWATDKLKAELREAGTDFKDHEVDNAIQAAYAIVWAELQKAKK